MDPAAKEICALIDEWGLAERDEQFAQLRVMLPQKRVSAGIAKMLLAQVQQCIETLRDYPNRLHRPPSEEQWYAQGHPDIELGTLVEAPELRFGLQFGGAQHLGVSGQTRAGKTILLLNEAIQIIRWSKAHPEAHISLIAEDFKNGELAILKEMFPDQVLYVSYHDGYRIGLNPPAGVPVRPWAEHFSTSFAARFGLKASTTSLARMFLFCVEGMNPAPCRTLRCPSAKLLLGVGRAAPPTLFGSKAQYVESLLQPLELFEEDPAWDVLNGIDLQRDIISKRRHLIIEMTGVSGAKRLFHWDLLLNQLLLYRQFQFRNTNRVDTVVMLDEADELVSRKAEESFTDGAMSPISRVLKLGGGPGIKVDIGLAALGPASRQVLVNLPNMVVMRVGDAESLREAHNTLCLPPGAAEMLPGLETGVGLVRCNNGWPHATMVRFDAVETTQRTRPTKWDQLICIPGKPLSELPEVQEALKRRAAETKTAQWRQAAIQAEPISTVKTSGPSLSKHARMLLDLASLHPCMPVVHLWSKVKTPSPGVQNEAAEELRKARLADIPVVRIGRMNVQLIDILDAGWQFLGKQPPSRKGRGGTVHRHFATWLAWEGRRRGYVTECEWTLPGTTHAVDCVWLQDGRIMVFEVVVDCRENLPGHISTCMAATLHIESLTIVAATKKELARIEASLRSRFAGAKELERVQFDVIENYMHMET